jgi:hypothetical protein
MKLRPATALFVTFAIASCIPLHSSLAGDDGTPAFREVEQITRTSGGDSNLPRRFNFGRPFVVSLNSGIPEVKAIRKELVGILNQSRILEQVVFEWFGPSKVESIQIGIGNRVPVGLAQSVLRVFSRQKGIPIILDIADTDGDFGDTQRVYVGGLVKSRTKPLSKERLEALLKDGIEQREFFRIAKDRSKDD